MYFKTKEIPVGSVWAAADGSDYQILVLGLDEEAEDILVEAPSFDSYFVDTFVFQYRYEMISNEKVKPKHKKYSP